MFLDGVEIGRQEDEFVPASLNEFPSFPGFVEGGVVHDDQRSGLKLLQGLFLEVVLENGIVPAQTLFRSFSVLLTIIKSAPASANAIEQALPIPFPAPVTKATLFLRFIFFKYMYKL